MSSNSSIFILIFATTSLLQHPLLTCLLKSKFFLHAHFDTTDLGEARLFLGIELTRSLGTITLCQKTFIQKIIGRFGLIDALPINTPISGKKNNISTFYIKKIHILSSLRIMVNLLLVTNSIMVYFS